MTDRRIFYFCYDHGRQRGGEKHSYQHVDVLNKNGFCAYAFHRTAGYRLTWFENTTAVVDTQLVTKMYDPERDIFVFPEDVGQKMLRHKGRRVIFNKNLFHGFQALGYDVGTRDPYKDSETIAALAVSDHNASHLRLCYPDLDVLRIWSHIRQDIFTYRPLQSKRRQIVCPKKATATELALYHMFRSRADAGLNKGADWNWIWLTGMTESESARIIQESPIVVFPSVEEGLARVPLEAMSCGSLVAAFRHGSFREILPLGSGFEYADVTTMLSWVEQVVNDFPDNVDRYMPIISAGREIAAQFNERRQTESVCEAWSRIFERLE